MRWRDIRFEKPTEADADEVHGEVIVVGSKGKRRALNWEDASEKGNCIAWMPLSELPDPPDRIPDPPEGWTWADKSEPFDKRAKFWHRDKKQWCDQALGFYEHPLTYIVPVDPPEPPEPQYRPFASAAEFEPYESKRWRYKCDSESTKRISGLYDDDEHNGIDWGDSFVKKVFADGSPFGVLVEE
jgi:hypothetical protein